MLGFSLKTRNQRSLAAFAVDKSIAQTSGGGVIKAEMGLCIPNIQSPNQSSRQANRLSSLEGGVPNVL